MAVIKVSGRGIRAAVGLFALTSITLLFSSCWLLGQPGPASNATGPVNDIVALVADNSGGGSPGTHVFYNDGKGNLSVGPVLDVASSGYTDLALGNLAEHAAPSTGGSPVEDIIVTNDHVSPNEVWINNGDGSFTQNKNEPAGLTYSKGVVLGPLSGHSIPDAFIVNDGAQAVSAGSSGGEPDTVLLNSTTDPGTFTVFSASYSNFGTGSLPQEAGQAVAIGDLAGSSSTTPQNMGNSTDVFQANNGPNQVWVNTVYSGGTNDYFPGNQTFTSSNDSRAVAIGNLDGTGNDDVFIANDGQANVVLLNDGQNSSSSFVEASEPFTASDSTAVALGDLNGDGTLDAFVVNSGSPDTVWSNNGHGIFTQITEPSQFNNVADAAGTAVALGDLNGDGILDAVVASGGANGTITVWLGNGDGTFTQLQEPNIPTGNYVAVAIGRLR